MRLGSALEHLHGSLADLADELRKVADRHVAQHDVHHLGHLLALRTEALAETLAPFARAYGQDVGTASASQGWGSVLGRLRRMGGELAGRSKRSGELLLRDLHELYLQAQECEIDWVIVRQGALAARDMDLVDTSTVGIQETRRIVKWLTTRIKESAPQVLASAG